MNGGDWILDLVFSPALLVLFGLWCLITIISPPKTEDRRTGRPWGYVGQWPPNQGRNRKRK